MRIQYIVGENEEKVGEVMISIIQKPAGFKIRRKGAIKQGNLFNVFNPEIQIYVDEWVWKLRKYINKKYFS